MLIDEHRKFIEIELNAIAKNLNLDIFDLQLKQHRDTLVIQILADRPKGGILIDECTALNKALCTKLEEDPSIIENYTVEVSSPGLDRPLELLKDYIRVTNRNVRFYLSEKIEGKLEHMGKVRDVVNEEITVETEQYTLKIPYHLINKATQEIKD